MGMVWCDNVFVIQFESTDKAFRVVLIKSEEVRREMQHVRELVFHMQVR